MGTKTKRVEVEITGEEVICSVRKVILEVPEDMSNEDVECINADHFGQVEELTSWEILDSSGTYAEGSPTFIGLAGDDAEPELSVFRDDSGEFRVRGHEKLPLS